ncbi:MAG TPA: MBL fold metallo-hydrolase [Nocardioides sp.]|uniref:MBL fold metallo-hydrolase n=1 Tax=Nocardioides sp. TaxID=35761 RepID=UPI002C26A919|nr:MBL fold metallo-hydrolase [Nocardioides sp.]HQR26384.1 MBL fold metallo-hydrolase [Nocardioides sp.]
MIRLTWIGHATVVIDLDGVRLVTDPLLRRHAGPLRRIGPPPDPAAWEDPDAVLVSHLHADHASVGSLRRLTGVPMLTGTANARWLRARVGARVPDLPEDRWRELGDVAVRLVRADHAARPMPHRPNGTHGHLLRGRTQTVWFAGDTSVYPEMAALPELAEGRVDVALLPIAGWGPRLSAGHMGPTEAVDAVELVRPRAVLPIHHGTLHPPGFELGSLDWMHRPLREFERQLAERCPEVTLLRVGLGDSVDVP